MLYPDDIENGGMYVQFGVLFLSGMYGKTFDEGSMMSDYLSVSGILSCAYIVMLRWCTVPSDRVLVIFLVFDYLADAIDRI